MILSIPRVPNVLVRARYARARPKSAVPGALWGASLRCGAHERHHLLGREDLDVAAAPLTELLDVGGPFRQVSRGRTAALGPRRFELALELADRATQPTYVPLTN
jgi:hypothetical protein